MFKRHFRFNHYTSHPAYVIDENNNSYLYLTITHAPYVHGKKCLPLNMVDKYGKPEFVFPAVWVADRKGFGREMNLKFTHADGPIIRDIINGKKKAKRCHKSHLLFQN